MKIYTAKVFYQSGHEDSMEITETQAKMYGDINNFIFKQDYSKTPFITKIEVYTPTDSGYSYKSITYDRVLEKFKDSGERVKIVYEFVNDEEEIRCYIGKSIGWIPIYLEIKRSDSKGGEGLLTSYIKSIAGTGKFKWGR